MDNKPEDRFEERIRFVAKHYREGRFDADKAWKQMAASKGIRRTIPFRRYLMAVASVVLLLVGITSIYFRNMNKPEWILVSTTQGQIKDVYLPDSTLVSMAGNTELRYNAKGFGEERREVMMKGKALFKVEHDESRPFFVQTDMAEVKVLGTTFQVDKRDEAIYVDVVEGKVRFTAGDNKEKEVILTAGMSAQYAKEMREIEVLTEENTNLLSWKTGMLYFQNTPLEKVIEDLTDHYHVNVRSRGTIRGERLTATFNSLPLDQVLMIINQTLDVRLIADKSN